MSEHGEGPCPRSILLLDAFIEDATHEIKIGPHADTSTGRT